MDREEGIVELTVGDINIDQEECEKILDGFRSLIVELGKIKLIGFGDVYDEPATV